MLATENVTGAKEYAPPNAEFHNGQAPATRREGMQQLAVSFFRNKTDAQARRWFGEWVEFISLFETPEVRAEKDGALFSPATFAGDKRNNDNVITLSMLVLDLDADKETGEGLSPEEAETVCESFGSPYAIYSTHSHQRVTESHTKPGDCLRVIIPMREPIPRADWPYLFEWANGQFHLKVDTSRRDLAGMFYQPAIHSADSPYIFGYETTGEFFDWREPVRQMRELEKDLELLKAAKTLIEGEKDKRAAMSKSDGPRPGDDFNARGDVRALLERHGWTRESGDSLGGLWRRPGKANGHGARLFYDSGWFYVFTSNGGPFEAGKVYDPFAVYTFLEHDKDFEAAARALAGEGYGAQHQVNRETGAPQSAAPVAHAAVLNKILEALERADFYALADVNPGSEIKQKHYVVLCVQELLEAVKAHNFALARKNDFIFVYNGEYWREIDRDTLKNFLGNAAERLGVTPIEAHHYEFKDKLYKQFLAAAHFEQAEPESGRALINLKNGTFEITADSQELRPFSAADFLKYQLPFDYDEEAKAPTFEAYLKRVLPEQELQNIISEFFGYVFTRKLKFEKALLLYGSGANGKSVLFDVMNALLGRENTANYSLSDLMQEHNRAQIAHKLLNYGSEINASVTKDVFKNLVSGEPIMARLKYGNSFLMEDYAKLCFNCNELPKDIEQTDAYFRRLLIVPFRVTIPEAEQDKELAQKIIAGEMSGVFNWVLAGLRRLLKNKRFTASKIVDETINDYKREADSVACYLDESETEPNGLLKYVYSDYRTYCSDSGVKALGKQKFRKRLEAHGFEVKKTNAGMEVSRKAVISAP